MASKWQGQRYDVVVVGCGNTYFTGFYRFIYKDLADVGKLVTQTICIAQPQ